MCLHSSSEALAGTGAVAQLALKPLSAALQIDVATLPAAVRSPSRRLKLWELKHRSHCPVIGSCLPMAELRRLARRVGLNERTMSDYSLHVYAVGQSQERNAFAELMQRELERRYATLVARFAPAHDGATLIARWRETAAAGDVAGALWAALTHAACDEAADKEIYGDIHMLSHQVGAGHRADLKRLATLEAELACSNAEARRNRERAQRRQSELELQLRERDAQLAEARCIANEHAAVPRRLEAQDLALQRVHGSETEWRRRAETAERKLEAQRGERVGLQRRIEALGSELSELGELRDELQSAERALAELLAPPAGRAALAACGSLSDCSVCPGGAAAKLAGRCLLCVGGRENLVAHYRGLVEGLGGRFLHHDGGIEDNSKQLEATLASADAVVCQAGCVSHAAYWKLKEYCKRTNKPCIYLKRSGVSSFARGVELLAHGVEADDASFQ